MGKLKYFEKEIYCRFSIYVRKDLKKIHGRFLNSRKKQKHAKYKFRISKRFSFNIYKFREQNLR